MIKICSKCILDTVDDPEMTFDSDGICNHCLSYDINIKTRYFGHEPNLTSFYKAIEKAKKEGENKQYDVLIGLSGGVDSTFVAYLCWKNNLKALAVHLDNGWNSAISIKNIKNILKVTGFDLYTHVIEWEEFKDLQRSYFKAHVVDIEALTDHAILELLQNVAKKHGISYIFDGTSITTEGRLPKHWVHNKSDSLNILSIHRRFGTLPIKTFPIKHVLSSLLGFKKSSVRFVSILDFYPYQKNLAKKTIVEEFNWVDYGGKHYESIFTRFYQGYILPKKFLIDKRKSHYSTLICAGQLTRNEAFELIKQDTYPDPNLLKTDYDFVLKKLGFSPSEFEAYISSPPIDHKKYGSVENFYDILRPFYRILKSVTRKVH